MMCQTPELGKHAGEVGDLIRGDASSNSEYDCFSF